MDNVIASLLSKAAKSSSVGGDTIDHGWSLLRELDALGFVINVRPGSRADDFMSLHAKGKSLNELCALKGSK